MFMAFWKLIMFLPSTIKAAWKFWKRIFSILFAILSSFFKKKKPKQNTVVEKNETKKEEKHEPYSEPYRDYSLPPVLEHDLPSELEETSDGIADES